MANQLICPHVEDQDYFRDGVCKACGFVCDHPSELHETQDTRQTVEYWGAFRSIGAVWTVCTQCGEDVTDLYDQED